MAPGRGEGLAYDSEGGDGGRRGSSSSTGSEMAELRKKKEEQAEAIQGLENPPLAESAYFSAYTVLISMSSLVLMALEADFGCRHCSGDGRGAWLIAEGVITFLFIVELILRLISTGPVRYIRGDTFKNKLGLDILNCTDVLVVILRIVDELLAVSGVFCPLRILSALRMCHLFVFARRVRLVKKFRSLFLITAGLRDTMAMILWICLSLLIVLWVFAIVMHELMRGQETGEHFDYTRNPWSVYDCWGTVPQAMFSLLSVLTMSSWSDELAWPLIRKYPAFIIPFVLFLMISYLSLINFVVSAMVEYTLFNAKQNKILEDNIAMKVDMDVMNVLEKMFVDADADESGTLDLEELHESCHSRTVKDRLEFLGIPHGNLFELFKLLDVDRTGVIPIDKYFRGCCRIRGPAMSRDMNTLNVDLGRNITEVSACTALMQDGCNVKLQAILDLMGDADREVVMSKADEKDPVRVQWKKREKKKLVEARNWKEGTSKRGADLDDSGKNEEKSMAASGSDPKVRNTTKESRRSSLIKAQVQASEAATECEDPADNNKGSFMSNFFGRGDNDPPPPPMPPPSLPRRNSPTNRGDTKQSQGSSKRGASNRGSFQWSN